MKRPRATGIGAWAGLWNRLLGAVATLLLLVGPVRAQSSDKLPEPVGRSITVTDFPMPGETVTLEWQQNSQNFVITAVE